MEFAYIEHNKAEERYELRIEGKLKAFTTGDHEKGLHELISMVEEKGYTVVIKD